MINKVLLKKTVFILFFGIGFFMSLNNYRDKSPSIYSFLNYRYKTIAKIKEYKNENEAGYYFSKALVEYSYKDSLFVSGIELDGVTLHGDGGYLDIYICSEDGNKITTRTNLLFEAGSLLITLTLGIIFLINSVKLVRVVIPKSKNESIN